MINKEVKFKAFSWLMGDYKTGVEKAKYLLKTAELFGYDLKFIGTNKEYIGSLQKLWVLEELLQDLDNDTIILLMDPWDTLFNLPKHTLIERFIKLNTGLLISAEKVFTYQYHHSKKGYDDIKSLYRYVNAGTYVGYVGVLRWLIDGYKEVYEDIKANEDQGLIGVWVHDNLDDRDMVKLDTDCDIFWVTSKDWNTLKKISDIETIIYNPTTNTIPCIIHNVGNGHPAHRESYDSAYSNIIKRTL